MMDDMACRSTIEGSSGCWTSSRRQISLSNAAFHSIASDIVSHAASVEKHGEKLTNCIRNRKMMSPMISLLSEGLFHCIVDAAVPPATAVTPSTMAYGINPIPKVKPPTTFTK